ncbi:MAG: pyrroloquinoline quinone biosynthesis protein PqqB [Rhizobiales bacterium]|nr:pyrroloquinoline quinone biosynthesis protein PqqB [Hyphomicrobiales bacterium]
MGRRAWAGDPAAPWRNQCSLAVSDDGEHWTLLNAAPEIRHQILATPELHPRKSPRHSPISAVVLTNGDIDHVAGLLTLRESQPFKLFATSAILDVLKANPIFNALNPDVVERRAFRLGSDLDTGIGLRVRPFAVPGKVPLYMEGGEVRIGGETEDTIGLEVMGSDGAGFFFIPGCAAVTPALAERLRGARLLLFDGTLWADDEMRAGGTGVKTGGRMGHMSVSGEDGSMAALAPLDIARKIYIHINNTNPILLADSPERAAVEAAGFEVAQDGMRIALRGRIER